MKASVDRQTHLVAGIIIWIGLVLAVTVDLKFLIITALPGCGLLLHALTGICPMTLFLRACPWNRPTA